MVFKSSYFNLPVALKQIHSSHSYNVQKYFKREWEIMKNIRHPNIVLYIGITTAPTGSKYLVSEFIRGGTLSSYINDYKGVIPWRNIVSIAIDISRGLAYLHERKVC